MTNWEMFERRPGGRAAHGPDWDKVPCISINSTGLSFNQVLLDKYSRNATQCFVMHANGESERQVGIKFVSRGEETPDAFELRCSNKGSKTKVISCKAIANAFSDLKGMAFRAMQDPQGKLVIADLSPRNRV